MQGTTTEKRDVIVMAAGAIVALLLQLVVAPYITIAFAMPNFIMAFVLSCAIARPRDLKPVVLGFVMGLVYNFTCGGVVGAMALLLTVATFALTRFFEMLDNDSLVMPFAALAISSFAIEILYAAITLLSGSQGGIADAFIFRALPCTIYDIVVSIVVYIVVRKFLFAEKATGNRPPMF